MNFFKKKFVFVKPIPEHEPDLVEILEISEREFHRCDQLDKEVDQMRYTRDSLHNKMGWCDKCGRYSKVRRWDRLYGYFYRCTNMNHGLYDE